VAIGGNSPLRRSISYTRDLVLPNQDNVFSITFAALNYSSPAATRYRYRLENLERIWNEVGSDQRQATYTTLPPGTYTFRVQGATRSGPWSEPGVALRIEILPSWWSTRPFQAAVGLLLILIAGAAYRQRVYHVAQRFEARLAERTRIARDLHDTLLQSFQASLIQMQAAKNLFSRRSEDAMHSLGDAISSAEVAIVEGRDAIQNLRAGPTTGSDLAHLLRAAGKELSGTQASNGITAVFGVTVEGCLRPLAPILQDELYRMGREILRNAFRHARATRIEVEIRYDERMLRLRIRDDGIGIDPKVLNEGAPAGHWGLPGVRERAKLAGAQLDFWSEVGAGTEVQVTVPASVAYAKSPEARVFGLFRKRSTSHGE